MANIVCKSWKAVKFEIKRKNVTEMVVKRTVLGFVAAPDQMSILVNKLPYSAE